MSIKSFHNSLPPKFHVKNLLIGNTYISESINPEVGKSYLRLDTTNYDTTSYLKKESFTYPPISELVSSTTDYTITYTSDTETISIPVTNKFYTASSTSETSYEIN